MPLTAATATYRVRIADRGATTVSGNVALTLELQDIAQIPTLSGPSVDVLQGTSTSHPFALECVVDTVLLTDSDRLAVIGRLIEIQRDLDGAGWSTLATGRVSGASEVDSLGRVTLDVSDERWVERETEIFGTTSTVQLHPYGLASDFMDFDAAGTETYTVEEVSGNAARIVADRIGTATRTLKVPRSLRYALAEDLIAFQDIDTSASNTSGNFTSLRFNVSSGTTTGDHTVIGFMTNVGGPVTTYGLLGNLRPSGDGLVRDAWVFFGSGHGLIAGDSITGKFYFPTAIPIRENIPLHIGGADGVHPMDLLEDILDGTYGGQAVRYDSTAMADLKALSFPPVWLRIDEPQPRAEWLAKNIYQPYGIAPLVGTDLAARPMRVTMPQDVSLAGLDTITASDESLITWQHGSRELVTVIRFEYVLVDKINEVDDRGEDWAADDLKATPRRLLDRNHDNTATLGKVVREYSTDLSLSPGTTSMSAPYDVANTLSTALFNVFGDGPVRGFVTVPDTAGYQVGELKLLDMDTIQLFNPDTAARTGDRLVRLIAFTEMTPSSVTFEYLDLGPGNAALAAPTVAIAQSGTDADLVDVTITNTPTGADVVIEVEGAATTPSTYTYTRTVSGDGTYSFVLGASSGNAYARAKSVAVGRIESAWATDSVALSARAKIRSANVQRTSLTDFAVTWSVPASGTDGMRTDYSVHSRTGSPTWGSNVTDYNASDQGFTVTGAMTSTRDMVTVKLTPYPTVSAGPTVGGAPGDTIYVSAIFVQTKGVSGVIRGEGPRFEATINGDGQVVCNVLADPEAANVYVTVGDGSAPADPTASVKDGALVGRFGTIATTKTITVGNDAYVKTVAADLDGNLGPVVLAQVPFPSENQQTTFEATNPVFEGTVDVQSGDGYNRVKLTSSANRGAIQFFEGTGPGEAGSIYSNTLNGLILASSDQNIMLQGASGFGSTQSAVLLNNGDLFGPKNVDGTSTGTGGATTYTTLSTVTWTGDGSFIGGIIEFGGQVTGTNATKGVRIDAGGTAAVLFEPAAGDTGAWHATVCIAQITTSSQRLYATWTAPDGTSGVYRSTRSINTLTTDFVVKLEGRTANSADEVECDLTLSRTLCNDGT